MNYLRGTLCASYPPEKRDEPNVQEKWVRSNCGIFHMGQGCRPGYIYIARCDDVYKIGCCGRYLPRRKSINYRVRRFQAEQGVTDYVFIHGMEANCKHGFEKYLHQHFKAKRVRGEFFKLAQEDLDWIKAIQRFNGGEVTHFDAP